MKYPILSRQALMASLINDTVSISRHLHTTTANSNPPPPFQPLSAPTPITSSQLWTTTILASSPLRQGRGPKGRMITLQLDSNTSVTICYLRVVISKIFYLWIWNIYFLNSAFSAMGNFGRRFVFSNFKSELIPVSGVFEAGLRREVKEGGTGTGSSALSLQ